jgi:hypothetical protein
MPKGVYQRTPEHAEAIRQGIARARDRQWAWGRGRKIPDHLKQRTYIATPNRAGVPADAAQHAQKHEDR